MKNKNTTVALSAVLIIYAICFVFRGIEYMFVRTDQTVLGEAFIHKLIGIAILFLALKYFCFKATDIGFGLKNSAKNIGFGLVLGAMAYLVAYSVEFLILQLGGNAPTLQFYVSSYSINGNLGNQTAVMFFAICVLGNIINVVMEEGVFRGLFLKLLQRKHSFIISAIVSSVLFGFWHIAAPLRSYLDGERSLMGTAMMILMLVITTAITGFKFCLLVKLTGNLWVPMADHFLNNTIINILHISTVSGADAMQTVRITIAQTVSFIAVLVMLYIKNKRNQKQLQTV